MAQHGEWVQKVWMKWIVIPRLLNIYKYTTDGLLLNKLIQDERGREIIYPERCLQSKFVWDERWQKDYKLYQYNILYPWSMVCTIQSSYTLNNMRASKAVSVKSFRATDAMTFKNMRAANAWSIFWKHACSKRNDSLSRTCVQQTQWQSFNNMRAANSDSLLRTCVQQTQWQSFKNMRATNSDSLLRTCVQQTQWQSFKNMRAANARSIF